MKKLRTAIIGQGRSGRNIHGRFFRSDKNEYNEVVAVVDLLEDRRKRAAEEYNCDVYADYRELFGRGDIDLVVNSTYSYEHYPITLDLLEHGMNVVVEKPFCNHAADCRKMIETAKAKGVMLNVFQQSRFAPYFTEIQRIIASGALGKIAQISIRFSSFQRRWDWQTSQRFGGGGLFNTGPHPLDQALCLLGFDKDAKLLYSRLDNINSYGDADDYCKLLLTAPGKPVIDIEITNCNAFSPYTYLIQAERGSLRATTSQIEYQYIDPAEESEQSLILKSLANDKGEPAYCSEQLHWHKETLKVEGSAFDVGPKKYYEMIYNNIVNGVKMEIEPWQSMQQIAMIEQAHGDSPMPILY